MNSLVRKRKLMKSMRSNTPRSIFGLKSFVELNSNRRFFEPWKKLISLLGRRTIGSRSWRKSRRFCWKKKAIRLTWKSFSTIFWNRSKNSRRWNWNCWKLFCNRSSRTKNSIGTSSESFSVNSWRTKTSSKNFRRKIEFSSSIYYLCSLKTTIRPDRRSKSNVKNIFLFSCRFTIRRCRSKIKRFFLACINTKNRAIRWSRLFFGPTLRSTISTRKTVRKQIFSTFPKSNKFSICSTIEPWPNRFFIFRSNVEWGFRFTLILFVFSKTKLFFREIQLLVDRTNRFWSGRSNLWPGFPDSRFLSLFGFRLVRFFIRYGLFLSEYYLSTGKTRSCFNEVSVRSFRQSDQIRSSWFTDWWQLREETRWFLGVDENFVGLNEVERI